MNFATFKEKYASSDNQLYSEFYDLFKEEISVKNKKIAIIKIKKIIKATFKLSANQSFASMSLRQLSSQTKLSMGGLYAYIANKEQLSLFIHQFLNHYVQKTMNLIEKEHKIISLENIIRTHIYLSEILIQWFFFAFMESKNLNKSQKTYAKNSELLMEKKLVQVILTGQKQGTYHKNISAKVAASHIKPLLHDWYLKRWKHKQRNTNIDDFCYSIIQFINSGLITKSS